MMPSSHSPGTGVQTVSSGTPGSLACVCTTEARDWHVGEYREPECGEGVGGWEVLDELMTTTLFLNPLSTPASS